jgi:hypothetical protein
MQSPQSQLTPAAAAAAAAAAAPQQRRSVTCHAAGRGRGSSAASKPRKGFGARKRAPKGSAALEPWEEGLFSPYRIYYKPGFNPPRYWGPIELQQQPAAQGVLCVAVSRVLVRVPCSSVRVRWSGQQQGAGMAADSQWRVMGAGKE